MSSPTKQDLQVSALAAGFTLGFGFLTVWEAIKQTMRNRNPLRSMYIYMIWGEIAANLSIGVIGWIWLDGILGDTPTVPLLFFILFFWVFEIQFLMQIIINRIAVISESPRQIKYLKYGTALVITMINIAVFCIFIPAHLVPAVNETYVAVNFIWDRISKVLILIVDAGLNMYFSRTVKNRLVEQHGLTKYAPLVGFNNKLMIVSILMDVMLIGLMSLPNQVVFVMFHPVVYMVKLNIEMSMATLITKLARIDGLGDEDTSRNISLSYATNKNPAAHGNTAHVSSGGNSKSRGSQDPGRDRHGDSLMLKSFHRNTTTNVGVVGGGGPGGMSPHRQDSFDGIHRRVDIHVERSDSATASDTASNLEDGGEKGGDDEISLTHHAGHPRVRGERRAI